MSDNNSKALPDGYILISPTACYKILGVLGKGGFGITYKVVVTDAAGNIKGDTPMYMAVKELFIAEYADRGEDNAVTYDAKNEKTIQNAEADFVREATMLNRLGTHHSNLVAIHEIFKANNTSYYTMDFLEGETLQEYIKRCGAQPIKWAVKLIAPLFDALECLHANRMTHLDIKPANIIMVKRGEHTEPVLIDFGLSKHYDEDGMSTSLVHNVACSKGYAPIEQYVGLTTFTPQADVYALAATLYYCLTGAAPEIASELSPKLIGSALPAALPEAARSAILRAMLKNKDHRTPSMAAFKLDLQKYMPAGMVERKPVVVLKDIVEPDINKSEKVDGKKADKKTGNFQKKKVVKKNRMSPVIIITIAAVVLLMVAGGVYLFMNGSSSRTITRAIANDDEEVLVRYAEADSVRAAMALLKLTYKDGRYLDAAYYVHKLDSIGYESNKLEIFRKNIAASAYTDYEDYMESNIPDAYSNVNDATVEFAIDLRNDGDLIMLMLGYEPIAPDGVLTYHRDRCFRRNVVLGNSYGYGSPEQLDAYRQALKFKDNSDLRGVIDRWSTE